MNTLCNNFRHLTYLAESLCNHFRISEIMGFIFRSRLYCLSQVRFAEIEIRPAEAESVNSWKRIYWYVNFPFLDSYFMQLASESGIRKQEFSLLEFPLFWQTFYRDFLNCRPKVYLFNTHWLWKYLQNWHQIHPRSKLAIKTFSRRNRIWSSFSADRLDRWSVATTPPYEKSLSTLVALGGGVRWRLATRSRAFLALSFGEEFFVF